ncbi:hypothetical protein [Mariniblastus fucicola]|uniref:Uncharacterized protein n=1 Tax=Mariniblastus fucicola TaxID=980251 RepID=A0A5B9P5X7_9BACT|nr:hypothetical protein [Mariniblastus fucicola]QEG21977.1 hypothetical protein MFFC18_18380 [Mariniblastus fucicola]
MKRIQDIGSIAVVTLIAHLIGSAVLAGVTGGPLTILAAPLLAFFGWFLLLPEFAIVAIQWQVVKRNRFSIIQAWLFTVLLTSVVFSFVAPKEQGSFSLWFIGYALGSTIAFSASFAIIWLSRAETERMRKGGTCSESAG